MQSYYNAITLYGTMYKNCLLLGDLNIVRDNTQLQNFCESFLFENLIKTPACYKGDTPAGIDHIVKNIPKRFIKSTALETGISGHVLSQFVITVAFCNKTVPFCNNIGRIL